MGWLGSSRQAAQAHASAQPQSDTSHSAKCIRALADRAHLPEEQVGVGRDARQNAGEHQRDKRPARIMNGGGGACVRKMMDGSGDCSPCNPNAPQMHPKCTPNAPPMQPGNAAQSTHQTAISPMNLFLIPDLKQNGAENSSSRKRDPSTGQLSILSRFGPISRRLATVARRAAAERSPRRLGLRSRRRPRVTVMKMLTGG